MVGLGRVELPTSSLGNCCSIHLSYSPDSPRLLHFYYSQALSIGGPRQRKLAKPLNLLRESKFYGSLAWGFCGLGKQWAILTGFENFGLFYIPLAVTTIPT
jgi:hypothetical protein